MASSGLPGFLLNRLHGGQHLAIIHDEVNTLLNRLHGGQQGNPLVLNTAKLLNRLHGGQLERYETISLSFKGLHIGTLQ